MQKACLWVNMYRKSLNVCMPFGSSIHVCTQSCEYYALTSIDSQNTRQYYRFRPAMLMRRLAKAWLLSGCVLHMPNGYSAGHHALAMLLPQTQSSHHQVNGFSLLAATCCYY